MDDQWVDSPKIPWFDIEDFQKASAERPSIALIVEEIVKSIDLMKKEEKTSKFANFV